MLKRTISIPLYDCKVIVIFAPDINIESKRICRKHKIDSEDSAEEYCSVISSPDSVHLYYILFGTDYLTLNRFVHEISHLGGSILKSRGYTQIDDEPLAYLNGYIAQEIEKIMLKNNIEFIKAKNNAEKRKVHHQRLGMVGDDPSGNEGVR